MKTFRDLQCRYAMLPLSAQLKDFWFRRLASLQDQKFISKTVATVDNLCVVDHVKFVMHCKNLLATDCERLFVDAGMRAFYRAIRL